MIPLIVTIGLLNLALGLALGIHLGYGPPGLRATWVAMSAHLPEVGLVGSAESEEDAQAAESTARPLPVTEADLALEAAEAKLLEEVRQLLAARRQKPVAGAELETVTKSEARAEADAAIEPEIAVDSPAGYESETPEILDVEELVAALPDGQSVPV